MQHPWLLVRSDLFLRACLCQPLLWRREGAAFLPAVCSERLVTLSGSQGRGFDDQGAEGRGSPFPVEYLRQGSLSKKRCAELMSSLPWKLGRSRQSRAIWGGLFAALTHYRSRRAIENVQGKAGYSAKKKTPLVITSPLLW